jgi:formate dehydrogenase subunit beta
MKEELQEALREALESGKARAAVVFTERDGELVPRLVTSADDPALDSIYEGDRRYPTASFAMMVLPLVDGKLALPVRECDRRMLVELEKYNQVDPDRLLLVGVPCSQEVADACGCGHPSPPPEIAVTGPLAQPSDATPLPEASSEDPAERLAFWMDSFSKCIRCMGCRNICPMCFCKECALDDPDLVGADSKPPEIPIFHLIRAFDMADRCIDCGMCESICPAEIPLRQLYRLARASVKDAFGYEPGLDAGELSPLGELGTPADLGGMDEGFRSV